MKGISDDIINSGQFTTINSGQITIIKPPVYEWEFRYFKNDNMVYMKEKAPCYLYRLMQKLILGVQWKRIS